MADSKTSIVEKYISKLFNGRISRGNFFVGYLIVVLGAPLAVVTVGLPLIFIGVGGLSIFIVSAASLLYGVSFAARRFHDIGRSTTELLWFLVPFVNIFFLFVVFIKAGDKKKNEHGAVPNKKINLKDLFGVK